MSRELICSVLGVPADPWPPSHYSLFGISPGNVNPADLEARASELSARLRTYQLSHPEPVTEALNRIAQALVCLQDPRERAAYDARLAGPELPIQEQPTPHAAPVRRVRAEPLRQTYRLLAFGRRWLDVWNQWGRWIGDPAVEIHSRRDAVAFIAAAWKVRDLSPHEQTLDLPGESAHAAAVVQLARRKRLLHHWRKLTAPQREALAADWAAAVATVQRECRRLRQRVTVQRGMSRPLRRWGRYFAGDGLDIAFVILALAAVTIALLRSRF